MKSIKKSFIVGQNTWMTNNSDLKEFNNGDPIPFITRAELQEILKKNN